MTNHRLGFHFPRWVLGSGESEEDLFKRSLMHRVVLNTQFTPGLLHGGKHLRQLDASVGHLTTRMKEDNIITTSPVPDTLSVSHTETSSKFNNY